jgi:type II secretory pathway pseudopilin PulG
MRRFGINPGKAKIMAGGAPATPTAVPGKRGRAATGEEGYILIAVIFLAVMILIALSVAAPKVAADIQRDREIELMHRGKQFQRAIQLYFKKFGTYPPTMEALEKQNEIRFLRKRYKDPMTGKDEWHLIHFGEAKTQTLGFFGQPLAGTGSAGGSVLAGTGPGATGGLGTPMGTPIGGADPNAANGQNGAAPTDPNAANNANGGINGATPIGGDPNAAGSSSSSSTGLGGQTFGGAGIIGVESTSPKLGILEYKKKKHYNEWEFIYDPLADRQSVGGGPVGAPIDGNGTPGIGGQPGIGSPGIGNPGIGNPGIGNPGGGGPGGISPVQPPQQQQQQ